MMTFRTKIYAAVLLAVLLLTAGCAKHYVITQELREPTPRASTCQIGDVKVDLPADTEPDALPPEGDLWKFQQWLREELDNKQIFPEAPAGAQATYEVKGRVIDYKRGSGVARFFIGFGVGNAKVVTELNLVDRKTGAVLFAANFRRDVSGGMEKGDKAFKDMARDFAKALDKQLKNAGKFEKTSPPDDSEFE